MIKIKYVCQCKRTHKIRKDKINTFASANVLIK